MEERIDFKGIAVFPGMVYGPVYKWRSLRQRLEVRNLQSKKECDEELILLKKSLDRTERELENLIQSLKNDPKASELIEILESQIVFLNDPLFRAKIAERISQEKESAELALETAVSNLYEEFQRIEDPFFRERADHLLDIAKRLSHNLIPESNTVTIPEIPNNSILIAKELSPSELISIDKSRLAGIATDYGGKTGHMAIIARSFGIPTVVGLKNLSSLLEDGEFVLLDGLKGNVKRQPNLEEIKSFGLRCDLPIKIEEPKTYSGQLMTKDGMIFEVKANVDTEIEALYSKKKGANGIGLLRSEILFIGFENHKPTEEEQYQIFSKILNEVSPLPVTVRVWDVGADKMEVGYEEANPFLGSRGIRYLLRHTSFFKEQIRALLRASTAGNLRVMLPMVTTVSEILETRKLWKECELELEAQGFAFSPKVPFGIMVETPASALNLPFLGKHVDFYSVGTNDLLQYLLAVERNNHLISELYNPFQLVFLLVLKNIAETAKAQKIPVSICGEVASDPFFIPILIGLGFKEISCALPLIDTIKKCVTEVSHWKSKELLDAIITLSGEEKYAEIDTLLGEALH